MVAGEASGDFLGAGLLAALRERRPELVAEGIGGARMIAGGFDGHYPMERLSVMGLVESLGRYAELLPMRARLAQRLIARRPDVFVGIDSPDFNLGLERRLRRAGIPTVHYVSPSVWAWRRYRVRKIARSVSLMLTLFPFEARFYEEHGVPVEFVGHPLADLVPMEPDRAGARRELGLPAQGEVVALLPGSRLSEVSRLAGPLLRTGRWLRERRPGLRFVAPLVDAATRACFEAARRRPGAELEVRVLEGGARTAMAAADAVLLASGTAALEALLLKRPMVIAYRMNPLTYRIMKAMFHAPFVGLPNLLAGHEVAPELLQDAAVPERLGPAVLALLERPALRRGVDAEFGRIHAELRRDASARAAAAVLGAAGA